VAEPYRDLLPEPEVPGRSLPWRALCAFFVPAASLALGVGLQRLAEGPAPQGDPFVRWLVWSSGAGLIIGALTGLVLGKRLLWASYGLAAPWVVAALVSAGMLALRRWAEGR
jgi:hypothetical protein